MGSESPGRGGSGILVCRVANAAAADERFFGRGSSEPGGGSGFRILL